MTSSPLPSRGPVARLSDAFERFHAPEFDPLHLSPGTFHTVLERTCAGSNGVLGLATAGRSFEGRTICSVSAGSGGTRVLLWSQMHGDESTATRALGDIFRYLAGTSAEPLTRVLLSKLTILALPMLNPDGAERCTRRTAQSIDMNRDALALRTPEARLLTSTAARFGPSVSFNLHDQELSTTGDGREITALALLAPAFDASRSDNPSRAAAKKVASYLAGIAGELAPGRIARYDDAFEPRAFGDTFQRKGYGTVLIESGHARGDAGKMSIRKMNFVAILAALERIAESTIDATPTAAYDRLPGNGKRAYDVIVRNVTVNSPGGPYTADLGISRQVDTHPEEPPRLVDAGDLGIFSGMEEFNGSGAEVDAAELVLNRPFDYARFAGA
jgi:hypothetical protein